MAFFSQSFAHTTAFTPGCDVIFPTIGEGALQSVNNFVEFCAFQQDTIEDMLQRRVQQIQNHMNKIWL